MTMHNTKSTLNLAGTLTSRGSRLERRGEYRRAERCFRRAGRVIDDAGLSGQDAARVRVRSTRGLADLYRRQGHLEAAELFLWSALELAESTLGPSDPDAAAVRRRLSLLSQEN
jgi:hypothetical protein